MWPLISSLPFLHSHFYFFSWLLWVVLRDDKSRTSYVLWYWIAFVTWAQKTELGYLQEWKVFIPVLNWSHFLSRRFLTKFLTLMVFRRLLPPYCFLIQDNRKEYRRAPSWVAVTGWHPLATFSWGSWAQCSLFSLVLLSGSIYYLPGAGKLCDYSSLFVFAL